MARELGEGLDPTWEDKLRGLFSDVERTYDPIPHEELTVEPPVELFQKIEELMRDEKLGTEAEAKKRAIQWWNDYKERRLRR